MSKTQNTPFTTADALKADSPLVLIAQLQPIANLDRFQPAGFPEVGHVIYKAPRRDGRDESVCIVDSAASMANHLESVCMRGLHDYDLADELAGMPYLRCVTGNMVDGRLPPEKREVVVTSLTEGHRIASTYFLSGSLLDEKGAPQRNEAGTGRASRRGKKTAGGDADGVKFEEILARDFGVVLAGSSKAHPPAEKWWNVFRAIFRYDPNSLVHGVLFPQWQIKIPRMLTAHLEAIGATRVDRSGVKFDRLGKTTSGQPIFAVDDAAAREIRATFIIDLGLVRSFGRKEGEVSLGLADKQKEFLVALALWKIKKLLASPFRFRSGCHLECLSLRKDDTDITVDVDMGPATEAAGFEEPRVTDLYWPREELYREDAQGETEAKTEGEQEDEDESETHN